MTIRTFFLPAPSFDGFDGGAGLRYHAKREVKSFWFPWDMTKQRLREVVEFSRFLRAHEA